MKGRQLSISHSNGHSYVSFIISWNLFKIFWVLVVINLPSDFKYQIGVSFS